MILNILRSVMYGDKEQPRRTSESFHSERPHGKHKSISPKAAKKPFLDILSYTHIDEEIVLLIYVL